MKHLFIFVLEFGVEPLLVLDFNLFILLITPIPSFPLPLQCAIRLCFYWLSSLPRDISDPPVPAGKQSGVWKRWRDFICLKDLYPTHLG